MVRRHGYGFFIGAKGLEEGIMSQLLKEQRQHSDLVLLEDIEESYEHLTAKVLAAYKWIAEHVPNVPFVFKVSPSSSPRKLGLNGPFPG